MSSEPRTPYISITAFTKPRQVDIMAAVYRKFSGHTQRHRLGVGVMTFGKLYRNEQTRWAATCPHPSELRGIFSRTDVFNCLHYADFDPPENVWRSIARALERAGAFVDGIQLDMCWPAPEQIALALHTARKHPEVILQVGREAFDLVRNDPEALVARLESYLPVIDRVLLDKSMGEGKELDPGFMLPFFRAIRTAYPELDLVAGGGLGPGTLALVQPLRAEFPAMSYDAQGKFYPDRDLFKQPNWPDAAQYLIEMLHVTR